MSVSEARLLDLTPQVEPIQRVGRFSQVIHLLYPSIEVAREALLLDKFAVKVQPLLESIDVHGGNMAIRGATGKIILRYGLTGQTPPGWETPARIWRELIADPAHDLRYTTEATLLSKRIPEVDIGLQLREGLQLADLAKLLTDLSVSLGVDAPAIQAFSVGSGSVSIFDATLPSGLTLQFFDMPSSFAKAAADCRASWNMPFCEAFAVAFVRGDEVYADHFASQALTSDRVSFSLSHEADMAQAMVATLRFFLTRQFFMEGDFSPFQRSDMSFGGVPIWEIIHGLYPQFTEGHLK